ncbi:MAG: sulfite exporter TauE/SafE family protein [Methylophilaceae bacterium]|nr:sulfite exporter TauE/SafE family protein [Methylophilaceae bacterium]MDG1445955.1 sulfite exporter TauE/SafE family protein [Methylophilaceae bacterium]MDG1820620.1 sulfite exporter TauE/SafE family protein [Methylophilaceae bacterium]MDG2293112.1 sulfite exporter TauE/SafE family protein [Methylophilaceae bacterium]
MDFFPTSMLIVPLIFFAALLYASVGHGGASGYLAVMALLSVAPESMRPAALMMNVLVSSIALYKFYRVKAFSWQLLLPIIAGSIPFAFIGGLVLLPTYIYKHVVGLVLIIAAWQIFTRAKLVPKMRQEGPKKQSLMIMGAVLGLLSGLTGVGGGIFLSPILILMNWAETKTISGIAAAFILVNSISGLAGVLTKDYVLPTGLIYWALSAVAGGLIGAEFGSRRLANPTIRQLLALVLVVAGIKMVATA